jgi:hypothetical protein
MRTRLLLPLVVAAGLLTACGGGEAAAPHPPGSAGNPARGLTTPKTASGRSNEATGTAPAQPQTAGTAPCSLVTREQASAIVGERLGRPREAVQGPTCVYRGRKSFVTIAMQSLDFSKIKPKLGRLQRVEVSNKVAYCGNYGQQMLYVPLARGSVLSVAAPCAQAKRFAALAVRGLSR